MGKWLMGLGALGAIVVGASGTGVAGLNGWLSVIGIEGEGTDSQVVRSVERTQEVSLVSLGIQGIKSERESLEVLGKSVPGTSKVVYVEYSFDAKLGVDGSQVQIDKTGPAAYTISIPEFEFIGYDEPTFKLAVEDDGALDFITSDVDKFDMVNEIFSDDELDSYLEDQRDVLEDQAQVFYRSLVTGIDATATVEFEFQP